MERNGRSGKRPKWFVLSLRRIRRKKRRKFIYKVYVFFTVIEKTDF